MRRDQLVGGAYAAAAFGFWGAIPVYWKALAWVPPLEMVSHRVVWAMPVMLVIVGWRGRMREVGAAIRDARHRGVLLATSALVTLNWLVFIWAVQSGRVLEASLGYFVNPLVNVLLGYVFLGERLRPRQTVAVCLAAAGVAWLTLRVGEVPWVALTLAATFGFYGLLRKRAGVDGLVGLAVETVFLAPAGLLWIAWTLARGESSFFARGAGGALAIVASGLVTAVPLLWFANAARLLRYATVGFFQYLAPTGQFLLAVFAYGEAFTSAHAVAFGLIWTAIGLYLAEAVRAMRPPTPTAPG